MPEREDNPPEPSSQVSRSTGFFRSVKRKGNSWEVAFKSIKGGIYIEVMYNMGREQAFQLQNELDALLQKYENQRSPAE